MNVCGAEVINCVKISNIIKANISQNLTGCKLGVLHCFVFFLFQFHGSIKLVQSVDSDSIGRGQSLTLCICDKLLDNKRLVHTLGTLSRKDIVCVGGRGLHMVVTLPSYAVCHGTKR